MPTMIMIKWKVTKRRGRGNQVRVEANTSEEAIEIVKNKLVSDGIATPEEVEDGTLKFWAVL